VLSTSNCHRRVPRRDLRTHSGATLGGPAHTSSYMETRARKRGGGRVAGAGAGGGGASGGASVGGLGGHPPSNSGGAWQILPATPPAYGTPVSWVERHPVTWRVVPAWPYLRE
jgi:hypothetical protein